MHSTTESVCSPLPHAWETIHAALETALPPRTSAEPSPAPFLVLNGHRLAAHPPHTQAVFQFSPPLTQRPTARQGVLTVAGEAYPCRILTITDDSVTLSIRHPNLPENLSHATLVVSHVDSSQGLHRRFHLIQTDPDAYHLDLAAKVFSPHQVPHALPNPRTPDPTPALNLEQRQAYERACTDDLLYIWGAPGTGKTTLMAQIVRTALTHGHRVLLCSTTNAAVDGALAQLHSLDPTLEASLLRVGHPSPDMAEALAPLTLDARLTEHAHPLRGELEHLLDEQRRLYDEQTTLTTVHALTTQWDQVLTQTQAIATQLIARDHQLRDLHHRLASTRAHLRRLNNKRTAFTRSRWWSRLFPATGHKLERTHRTLTEQLSTLSSAIQTVTTEQQLFLDQQEETHDLLTDLAARLHALGTIATTSEVHDRLHTIDTELQTLAHRQAVITDTLHGLRTTCLHQARLVATTLTRTASSALFHHEPFDLVLIDEVSMAALPQLWATVCLASTQVILVGDILQLPPITTHLTPAHDDRLFRSIYDWSDITHASHPLIAPLQTQYRMHPVIMDLPARLYRARGLTYQAASQLADTLQPILNLAPFPGSPVGWADTTQSPLNHIRRDAGHSPANWYHAVILLALIRQVLNTTTVDQPPTLAVMSPYRAQVALLQHLCAAVDLPATIRVGTIHQFQGQQADITLIDTTVIAALSQSLVCRESAHMSATKLLNVAITRTRGKVIFVGVCRAIAALPPECFLRRCLHLAQDRGVVQATHDWPLPHAVTRAWFRHPETTERDFVQSLTTPHLSPLMPSTLRLVG